MLQWDRKTHIEFQVTGLKVKVIITHKQTIISSAKAMNIFQCKYFLLHIPTVDEKREVNAERWVERSKVNLPATFWVHLFSDRISWHILVSISSYFVYRFRMIIERCQKVLWQTVIGQGQSRPLSESAWWLSRFKCILPVRALYVCVLLSTSDNFSLF